MIINILLLIDFIMLAVVVSGYVLSSLRERKFLTREAERSRELAQKVYQAKVLNEIAERIGYALDADHVVEIITSSLGNLLPFDVVSDLVVPEAGPPVLKVRVENSVNHLFLQQTRERVLASWSAFSGADVPGRLDERISGTVLDDNLDSAVRSYFNVPVTVAGRFVGVISVASAVAGQYGEAEAGIVYTITNQAAQAATKLKTVLDSERGKLAAAIRSLADGYMEVDRAYQITTANPALKTNLGLSGDGTVTAFDVADALGGKLDLRTKVDEALTRNEPIRVPGVEVKNRILEVTVTPVKDAEGGTTGASVVFHDTTTEKQLERVRNDFTAMMVHELRAPLTAIRWSAEALEKDPGQHPAPDILNQRAKTLSGIREQATGMLELVSDLLDVAKLESGKFELNEQDYDLAPVVHDAAERFRPLAEGKGLGLAVTVPASLHVRCDRVRVQQVLGNLMSNAVKYTDEGSISVSLSEDGGRRAAVVAVKDSGIGLDQGQLARLFSKFRQLTERSERTGTGLGLVVAKGIVESHGGQIWAESPGEGAGSTFSFTLPLPEALPKDAR